MPSPYLGQPHSSWLSITESLVDGHPFDLIELGEIVLMCWDDILTTRIADRLHIGVDVRLSPQMMSNFLHALIPVELAERHPGVWRKDETSLDKDIVYVPDDRFSTEIKASSHARDIFANRSYAQPSAPGTKVKDGYYLAINFEPFRDAALPRIRRLAFGWLDHSDWVPQASATGQQAHLTAEAKAFKLIPFYPNS